MALIGALSATRSAIFREMAQTLCLGSGRHMASATTSKSSNEPQPTYTYMPPGCSMREPLYFSMSDPVYFVDPKPESPSAAASSAATLQQQTAGFSAEEKAAVLIAQQQAKQHDANASAQGQAAAGQQQQQARPGRPSMPGPSTLRKVDLSHIQGKYQDDGRPVSYRMQDDMAQVPYVTNATTHSMREPKYVSVSEPRYPVAGGQKK